MKLSDFSSFPNVAREFHSLLMRKVDERMSSRVQELEGRMPTHEEIAQHGLKVCFPDGRTEYHWKDRKILEVVPPELGAEKLVWTING